MDTRSVLITGTTSGVGRALLEHYVARGVRVIAVNRRHDAALEARFAQVRFECVDVRDTDEVAQLISSLVVSQELPDAFLLNAGINRVDNDESFQLEEFVSVIDTNLYGALNFAAPLTRLSPGPVARHVVAIGSMASYVGNPFGLGYSVSKRALAACFETWSAMYSGTDLVFQQVMLGPVQTGIYTMSDKFPAWMVKVRDLFSGSVDKVAAKIARFATTRRKKLFCPSRAVPLYFGMWVFRAFGLFRGRRTLDGRVRRSEQCRTLGAKDEAEGAKHG